MIPKASNLVTPNGTVVPNQIKITVGKDTYFQSYDSVVLHIDENSEVHLGPSWDYSRTTAKYVGRILNKSATEIRELLQSNDYKLVDYLD